MIAPARTLAALVALLATLALPAGAAAAATGTISYPDAVVRTTVGSVSTSSSGATSTQLERRTASYMAGTCAGYGSWAAVGPANPTATYTDTTLVHGSCYQYRLRMVDSVPVTSYATSASVLRVDTVVPTGAIDAMPVSPFRGSVTLTGTASDATSGVAGVSVAVSGPASGSVCTGQPATWSCGWNTAALPDGLYTLSATITDLAGNTSTVTRNVIVDNSAPTASLQGFVETVNPQYQYASGATMYVNAAMTGSFAVNVSAADAGTGVARVDFPALGTGWTAGGSDSTAPSPYSYTYSWAGGALSPGARTATAFDNAGSSSTVGFTVVADATPPGGGSIAASWTGASPVITFNGGSDAGSGIATRQLQRRSAQYVAGTCGAWSAWSNLGAANPVSPYTDAGATAGTCWQYQLVVTDNVGNVSTATAASSLHGPAVAGITIAGGAVTADEAGATGAFTVVLDAAPTAPVSIATSDPSGQVDATPSVLVFTPANWSVPQAVTVSAIDDAVDETSPHDGAVSLTVTSTDPAYDGLAVPAPTVAILDDDVAGVVVAGGSWAVTEGGATNDVDVVLTSQPLGTVTVSVGGDAQVGVTPPTATFTAGNWNVPQALTLAAIDDTAVEASPHAGAVTFSVTSPDAAYAALLLPNQAVQVTDNDAATPPPPPPPPPPAADTTPPAGGSIAVPTGITRITSVPVTFVVGVDAGSGIASWRIERRAAEFTPSGCGSYGVWAQRGPANPASPFADIATSGACVEYRLVVTDAAGNAATFAAQGTTRFDFAAPSGAVDPIAAAVARGSVTLGGTASDTRSAVSVSVRYSGPATGDICVGAAVSGDGRWACAWDTTALPGGTYTVTVRLRDEAGNERAIDSTTSIPTTRLDGGTTTGTPTPPTTPPPGPDHVAPALTRAVLGAVRFLAATGTTLAITLDGPAKVKVEATQKAAGHRVGTRCAPGHRAAPAKPCTVVVVRAASTVSGKPGPNSIPVRFPRLTPGTYMLTYRATDAAGNVSRPGAKPFTVLAPRRVAHG